MASPLFLLQAYLSGTDTGQLMAVENSFPKDAILIQEMLLKVNYFTADKGKNLVCRAFIEAEVILFCMYGEFHMI